MDFKEIRIIEAGETENIWYGADENGQELSGKIVIKPESLSSLVELGNKRPIHSRRTHNGNDLLDQYIGTFSNFVEKEGIVYADFTFSPAMIKAYPAEVDFMRTLIEEEPDMLGVSVVDVDKKEWNPETNTYDVTEFEELFACDLVGMPAATKSLFNKPLKNNEMGIFSGIISAFSKSKYADQEVTTANGDKITVRVQGEEAAIGDEVLTAEGEPVADGEVVIDMGEEGKIVLVVEGGKIKEFKEFQEEAVEEETEVETKTPDEFSKRLEAMEASVKEIKTMLSKQTKTPTTFERNDTKKKTELSKEEQRKAVQEATAMFLKKK